MELEPLRQVATAFTLSLPRLMAVFIILPVMGKKMLGGRLIRNGVVFSLVLFICPTVVDQMQSLPISLLKPISAIVGIVLKETAIGLMIGYCASLPFWVAEASGFFIDNQRGATMASSLNPALESQSSPLGILLTLSLVTLFFSSGALLLLLGVLYKSYLYWPVTDFYPQIQPEGLYFLAGQLGMLVKMTVIFAAPVIIAMFMAEFGLALISRFAPQLNVFSLSMPVKSGIGGAVLLLYFGFLMTRLATPVQHLPEAIEQIFQLISSPQP